MELHRLDGLPISGLDNVDIQDIDLDGYDSEEIDFEELDDDYQELDFSGLGYVKDPVIAYEILDENGNVIMYADEDENIYAIDGLGELGFLKKIGKGLKNASKFMTKKANPVLKKVGTGVKNAAKFTVKKVVKPVVEFTNRYLNPATILLRNGFLLAMKVNFMKVAEKLRFGYLSDAEARKRGVNMGEFSKLKKAISSAEKVYETAGGKKENLRKTILSGKGNSDKAVPTSGSQLAGLGLADEGEYVDEFERFIAEADNEEVEALLQGVMSVEGLGEVATGSALAAASSAVAAVATVLNKITGVFDKAKKTKEDVTNVVNTGKSLVSTAKNLVSTKPSSPVTPYQLPAPPKIVALSTPKPALPATVKTIAERTVTPAPKPAPKPAPVPAPKPATSQKMLDSQSTTKEVAKKESWASKNKILLIGTGILLAGGGVAYAVVKSKKKKPAAKALAGLPRGKNGKFKSRKKKTVKKKVVAPKVLL
ncbi:hypothetical protein C900_02349 [Fulvivirga imtechensis AK7]|uniref:Uncharacterized protein n=1 Tax=Fulvivirga imtechensis AK7 TaxID=1237149 RepID=L8JVZ4_9BACT|nr:hypothetical protein [Fulvivirga imtechensis]ELR71764.1 hypothetical protein C900_02349 [Fulvivirga imtechensis AK7]